MHFSLSYKSMKQKVHHYAKQIKLIHSA